MKYPGYRIYNWNTLDIGYINISHYRLDKLANCWTNVILTICWDLCEQLNIVIIIPRPLWLFPHPHPAPFPPFPPTIPPFLSLHPNSLTQHPALLFLVSVFCFVVCFCWRCMLLYLFPFFCSRFLFPFSVSDFCFRFLFPMSVSVCCHCFIFNEFLISASIFCFGFFHKGCNTRKTFMLFSLFLFAVFWLQFLFPFLSLKMYFLCVFVFFFMLLFYFIGFHCLYPFTRLYILFLLHFVRFKFCFSFYLRFLGSFLFLFSVFCFLFSILICSRFSFDL